MNMPVTSDMIHKAKERGVKSKTLKELEQEYQQQQKAAEIMANLYISEERKDENDK